MTDASHSPGPTERSAVGATGATTRLLAASVVGVYLLVVVGATASLANAAEACSTWLCAPDRLLTDPSPALAVAVGHRVAAALVGLLVVGAGVAGWRTGSRRVRAALALAVALYPIQVALGAFVATGGAAGALPALHLGVAMAIFVATVCALAWHLERETGDPDESPDGPAAVDRDLAAAVTDDPRAATDGTTGRERPTGLARLRATAWAYFQLTKPRLMWLLVLVAGAAMTLAGGPGLSVGTIVATLGGGVLAIGASGTFNHVLERDVDRLMSRTSDRPLASDEVPARNALVFGVVLAVLSVLAFLQVNLLAAGLGFAAIVFYSVVYTLLLKPNTVQNTVIGGAAGALPALIGWAAVTGEVGLPGVALAGLVFLWTPAHFYNLALAYREDYERGGFPMMPVVRGETVTRKHILWYLAATLLSATALAALTDLGWLFAATTVALGGAFLWAVVRLHYEQTESAAFRAFHASNAYLGLVLVAVVLDSLAV